MPLVHIDKDTVLCISIAARPSNFGTKVHNAAFQARGLNFVYKAFGIQDIDKALAGVRALGIRGCGVSMPFKESILPFLDRIDPAAQDIGAVNTVVNENGILTGYNTDADGALEVLGGIENISSKKVLLMGAGGVAKAILSALNTLKVQEVVIANRSLSKAEALAQKMGYRSILWEERFHQQGDVLINATSIGMHPDMDQCPVKDATVGRFSVVMDVVVFPVQSLLLKMAAKMNKRVIYGHQMSLHQAARQFQLYTGQQAPLEVMGRVVREFLDEKK